MLMDTDKDFIKNLTAEYAEVRIFTQSGDDDWAKDPVFKKGIFLFVVVSRQTKKEFSAPSVVRLCSPP